MLFTFLRAASRDWRRAPALHVVIGNEAADADSCVGALVYALHLARQGAAGRCVLPVISCARAEFELRREALVMLQRAAAVEAAPTAADASAAAAGVLGALTCLDDLAAQLPRLRELALAGSLAITLVDHNQLTGVLAGGEFAGAVCEIVDHHADAGAYPHVAGERRNISFDPATRRGVGSACTLVAERLAGGAPALLTPALAELLLGVILLDTACLSEHAGKATPRDHAVAELLVRRVEAAASSRAAGPPPPDAGAPAPLPPQPAFDAARLYAQLSSLREDPAWWASLSPAQALAYDYKGFAHGPVRYGTGVLAVHATRFMRLPPAGAAAPTEDKLPGRLRPHALTVQAVLAFAQQRGLDFFVLLSRAPNGKRRAVLLYAGANPSSGFTEAHFAETVVQLKALPGAQLVDVPVEPPVASAASVTGAVAAALRTAAALKFGDHRVSRKQVVPMLGDALDAALRRAARA